MKRLFKYLRCMMNRISHDSSANIDDRTRTSIKRDIISICPVCHEKLNEHFHWMLASEIVEPSVNKSDRVLQYITERQWMRASEIKEWSFDRDIREYQLIKCPKSTQLGLVVIVYVYGLYENDFVESSDVLDEEDSRQLIAYVGEQWESL